MIPEEDYIRIVLGLRSSVRQLKSIIGELPLQVDQRRNVCSKIHRMSDDVHIMYMDLKEQGLID